MVLFLEQSDSTWDKPSMLAEGMRVRLQSDNLSRPASEFTKTKTIRD